MFRALLLNKQVAVKEVKHQLEPTAPPLLSTAAATPLGRSESAESAVRCRYSLRLCQSMQHCITARRSLKVGKQTAAATRQALPEEADTQESGGGDGQRLKEVTGEKTKGE